MRLRRVHNFHIISSRSNLPGAGEQHSSYDLTNKLEKHAVSRSGAMGYWATSQSKKGATAGTAFRVRTNEPTTLLADNTIRVDLQLAPVAMAVASVWDLRFKIVDGTDFYVIVTSLNAVFNVIFGTFEQFLNPCDAHKPALNRLRFMFHIGPLR